jgi:orotidine-5'-phosphate decarboxylase
MPATFDDRLGSIQRQKQSAVCVGLDPDPNRLPASVLESGPLPDAVRAFCHTIIDATAPVAAAFKVNLAFFEALGVRGPAVLHAVADYVPDDCLLIADGKRGDIGNSARFYAHALYDDLGADACTVAPYMGRDAVLPFLDREDAAAFVLARTSNPGAADLQEACTCDGTPLYLHVAQTVAAWSAEAVGRGGLVVGATAPDALADLRAACPSLPFLIPGVGAQGGDPQAVMDAAATPEGRVLVNSSRSILYASSGDDFADAAAEAAQDLRAALGAPA